MGVGKVRRASLQADRRLGRRFRPGAASSDCLVPALVITAIRPGCRCHPRDRGRRAVVAVERDLAFAPSGSRCAVERGRVAVREVIENGGTSLPGGRIGGAAPANRSPDRASSRQALGRGTGVHHECRQHLPPPRGACDARCRGWSWLGEGSRRILGGARPTVRRCIILCLCGLIFPSCAQRHLPATRNYLSH